MCLRHSTRPREKLLPVLRRRLTMNVMALHSLETSEIIKKARRANTREDQNLQQHRCYNAKRPSLSRSGFSE
jgi:hypothetical protein